MKKRFWTIPLMVLAVACTVFLGGCGGPSVEELIREDLETAFPRSLRITRNCSPP